jgi:ABC-type nitrate/sulfonate/bicarbonate transport system ATPase subunit
MSISALSIHGLSIVSGARELYRGFSLEAEENKVTCMIAPSGSGKTTLLDFIAGTLYTENVTACGEILFAGKTDRPAVSFLFQEPRLIPSATVMQNVVLPLVNVMDKNAAEARARLFIDRVQLSAEAASYPDELSGGEKQRVSMARSFAFPSKLLLMDEPFQSQDLRIKLHLMDTLQQLLDTERRTVLFVTHDVKEAVLLSDRIIVMDGTPLHVVLDEKHVTKSDTALEKHITSLVVHP